MFCRKMGERERGLIKPQMLSNDDVIHWKMGGKRILSQYPKLN